LTAINKIGNVGKSGTVSPQDGEDDNDIREIQHLKFTVKVSSIGMALSDCRQAATIVGWIVVIVVVVSLDNRILFVRMARWLSHYRFVSNDCDCRSCGTAPSLYVRIYTIERAQGV
jgi:hypothetical protein